MRRSGQAPSQRQLRVGELLRHALSEMFTRAETREPVLDSADITVLEVSVSPDLKRATAYVMPLGGTNADAVVTALKQAGKRLRAQLARRVNLKFTPELDFKLDTALDNAGNIDRLLSDPRVARDLDRAGGGGADQ